MAVQYVVADCLEWLPTLPDNSVDLIIADPPYNIKKDHWDNIDNYIPWCLDWIKECCRVLKDNGSFYVFHSEMPIIAELMIAIRQQTELCFKQFIVWNKIDESFKNLGFVQQRLSIDMQRNYYDGFTEYVLFYTFQDATGLDKVKLDVNNFQSLRQYFYELLCFMGESNKSISKKLGHRKAEHAFYVLPKKEVIDKVGQKADHCFRYGSTQWDLPTEETYNELISVFKINEWSGFREYEDLRREYEDLRREYEDLRREYEDLRYPFNVQNVKQDLRSNSNVWLCPPEERNGHTTPKHIDIIKNIILHSSHPNHIILDPFLGSGTTLRACLETGRNGIGCEKNIEYEPIIKERIRQANIPLTQFEQVTAND